MYPNLEETRRKWRVLTAWEALGLAPDARTKSAAGRLTNAYMAIMLLALPLVLHDGYFDVTEAKWIFFCAVSAAYLCLLAVCTAISALRSGGRARVSVRTDGAGICLLLFAAAFPLAALYNASFAEDLLGAHNRYQGILTVLLYAGVYFALARYFRVSRAILLAPLSGFCLVTLLAAANGFGLDPLGALARLSAFDRGRYISTMGNINFYSGYLSLLLPFCLALWCHAQTPFWRAATGFALVCGALGMLPSGSESLFAALLTAGLILPYTLLRDPRALRRLFAGGMLMLAALACAMLLARCFSPYRPPSLLMRCLTWPPALLGLFSVCAALYAFTRRCDADQLAKLRKPYSICICGGLLLFALFVILANTLLRDVSFGALDPLLKLGPDWGTDRGRIWAYCMDVFARYGVLQKLFGGGTGILYALDSSMAFFGDAVLDNAHNEYLHYLLTVGIFGSSAYVGTLFCTLRAALARAAADPLSRTLALGVAGYAAQAFFNIAQPVSTPFLFLFLGMAAGLARKDERR